MRCALPWPRWPRPGTDIAFSEERTDGYRAFANKIWNAARFIFMQMERAAEAGIVCDLSKLEADPDTDAPLEARWILSRLHRTAGEINEALRGISLPRGGQHAL